MKLHFEPNLDFQLQAIEAVCDVFGGQEVCRTEFTVTGGLALLRSTPQCIIQGRWTSQTGRVD